MNIFGLSITRAERKSSGVSIDTIIRRLEAVYETLSGIAVTPDTAMQSPTVHAIVTAVSRRIAALPLHVLRKTDAGGRMRKEHLPSHPVQRLLRRPNGWQSSTEYMLDAAERMVLWGNFYAFKARGLTGPIRRLEPLLPGSVAVEQSDDLDVTYTVHRSTGEQVRYTSAQMHHVRGPARNGVKGDSPVMAVREAIALEIAAEKFGASFFGNGAMPGMIFQYSTSSRGHRTNEEMHEFISDFQEAYGRRGRFRAMILPPGVERGGDVPVDNNKGQFLETRKLQRNIIAGAFGVPPHLVGDLERATFSNIEHQSRELHQAVILPYCRMFESAMERDLLTTEDINSGVIIRFNLDGQLRGDFKSRQEGLKIQREAGVISPNDWREYEDLNPIAPEDGGDAYWQQGPSGQTGMAPGAAPADEEDANGAA